MKILRIVVVLFAIMLAVLFIRERHNAGRMINEVRYDHSLLEDHATLDQWNKRRAVFISEKLGAILVQDRFRDGGMISLDSLKRRVQSEQFILSSSKSVMMRWSDPERDYLDSLLAATHVYSSSEDHEMNELGTGAPHSREVNAVLVEDRFGNGDMISLDSLISRVQGERSRLWFNLEEVDYLDSILAASYDQYIVKDDEKVRWNKRKTTPHPPEWAAVLVEDRFGNGGMIALDHLMDRVHRRQLEFHRSKWLGLMSSYDEEEWRYLDSLLQHYSVDKN